MGENQHRWVPLLIPIHPFLGGERLAQKVADIGAMASAEVHGVE